MIVYFDAIPFACLQNVCTCMSYHASVSSFKIYLQKQNFINDTSVAKKNQQQQRYSKQ